MQVSEQPRLDGITSDQWHRLFPDHPDPLPLLRLMQDCGMDGFQFDHIRVTDDNDQPILLMPVFEVRFKLASLVEGWLGKCLAFVKPKLLGIGFVEGEWGQIGNTAPPALPPPEAWKMAVERLDALARKNRAKLIVMLNFTPAAVAALPAAWTKSFARIDTIPCARLNIDFANVDEYLNRLSKNMRKDLRRKMKSADQIRIERTTQIEPWLDRIESLYRQTLARAELSLGIQRRAFFQRVCGEVAGAHYVLYFQEKNLLAFNLLVEHEGQLIDKYFCMDEIAGRELSLYFLSWIENVRYCCQCKLKTYHAGPGAEATKARLGATFTPSITLFRHRNPIIHQLLRWLRPLLAYSPEVQLPP